MYYKIIYNDEWCRSLLCKCCHIADSNVAHGNHMRAEIPGWKDDEWPKSFVVLLPHHRWRRGTWILYQKKTWGRGYDLPGCHIADNDVAPGPRLREMRGDGWRGRSWVMVSWWTWCLSLSHCSVSGWCHCCSCVVVWWWWWCCVVILLQRWRGGGTVSGCWSSYFHITPGILIRKRMGGEGPVLTKMNDDEEWRQMSPFAVWLPSRLQRCGTWISYQKVMGEGGVLLTWLAPWLYYPPHSCHLVGPSCGRSFALWCVSKQCGIGMSFLLRLGHAVVVEGGGWRPWMVVAVGESGDVATMDGRCGQQWWYGV